jgi:hypothetical protein
MARKKNAVEAEEQAPAPEIAPTEPEPQSELLGPIVEAEIERLAEAGVLPPPPKTEFTEAEQNAYAAAAQTTGARNIKGYDDIHDWYRRTRGGEVDA